MSEIKPCPFCGSIATVHGEGSGYHVRCNNQRGCSAIGPWINDRDASKAIAAWNQRLEPVGERFCWVVSQGPGDDWEMLWDRDTMESAKENGWIVRALYTSPPKPVVEVGERQERDHRAARWKAVAKRLNRSRMRQDGRDYCEGCERLIPEDERHMSMVWEDGIITCPACSPMMEELAAENAILAGDAKGGEK